jgi:hypothetical protein
MGLFSHYIFIFSRIFATRMENQIKIVFKYDLDVQKKKLEGVWDNL